MAIIVITPELQQEIDKTFRAESLKVIELMHSLKTNPKKGKAVGVVGAAVIKELKYKKWRFYFITDGYKVKFLKVEELQDLIIKFVGMSDKKAQQQMIEQIKQALRAIESKNI